MKLIIDIPEEVKHKIYAYGLSMSPSDKEQLIKAIMNGIPLDNLRAEIEQYKISNHALITVKTALAIIDKYREGEQE